jgi:methyltransferase-like protein
MGKYDLRQMILKISGKAKNLMIMSWLLYSMLSKISQGYLFLCTAKEVWDAVAQKYSKMGNVTQIYELKRQIHRTQW